MTPEPIITLLITLGGAFTLLALLSPKAALAVLLPTIALTPEVQLGQLVLRPDDLLLVALTVAWGLRRLAVPRAPTPLDRPLAAYVVVGLVATLWGAAIGTADLTSTAQLTGSGLHMLKRLQFVIYFFILTDTLRSVADVRRFVFLFMTSLAALSAYSLLRFYETGRLALAPIGAAVHEPGLAAMLNVALALGLLVGPRRFGRSLLAGFVLLASLWILPFSLGRNFMISTAAMFGLVALSRQRGLLLFVPLAWVLGPLLLPGNVLARVTSIRYAFSPAARLDLSVGAGVYVPSRLGPGLGYGWEVLGSSPLLGWGLASVALGGLDSEYANQFVSTGILGFAVFVWLVVRIIRMSRDTFGRAKMQNPAAIPLVAGLQYALVGYGLYSLFSPSISAARAGAFFFTILALLATLHRELARPGGTETDRTAPGLGP